VQFGDIELYDAPNARIVHMYNSRKKAFVKILAMEDIFRDVHMWSLFKNRTIVFFGDFDGLHIVLGGTINNKVYYYCTQGTDDIQWYLKDNTQPCNYRNLEVIPNITSVESFMKACKKLK